MIIRALKAWSVPEEAVTLLSPADELIPRYLLMGDAGFLIIEDLPTARKAVSVKFGEYLACGLPVICTPFVEGAAGLVRDYDCGIVVNRADRESFKALDDLIRRHDTIRRNGFHLVQSYLSVQVNAGKFLAIYRDGMAAGGK